MFSGYYFAKKSVTNIRKARKIFPKSQQRIVGEKIWEWWVYLPPISMKKCPLSSEGKFFEDHGCLFANLAAYYLGGYFEIVSGFYQFRWLPNRKEFLQTLYNSRIFVLLDEVIKYFFDFVAGFSHSRCLPLRGIFIFWLTANFWQKSSQLNSER